MRKTRRIRLIDGDPSHRTSRARCRQILTLEFADWPETLQAAPKPADQSVVGVSRV